MQVQFSLRYLYLSLMFSGLIWLSAPTASQAQSNICQAVTQISAVECEALVTLYDNTHSTGWNQRASWLLTETPCEWHGVTCRNGHVVTLALSRNNLNGTLPSAIGDLTHLEVLDLAENQLSGKLPPELGSLRQLKWLYLNDNVFSGPLPTSLMNLDNLEKLWFYHTNLCEAANAPLTTWLGSLADVQHSGVICVNVTAASVNLTAITATTSITALDATPVMTEVVGSRDKMTATMNIATVATKTMTSTATMTSAADMNSSGATTTTVTATTKMTVTATSKMSATTTPMTATTSTANELTIASSKTLTTASAIPQSGDVLTSTNGAGLVLAAIAMIVLLGGGMVINRKFYPERLA